MTAARLACLLNYSHDIKRGKHRNYSASLSFTNSQIGHILMSHRKVGQPVWKDSLFTAAVPGSAAADQVGRYLIVLWAEARCSWLALAESETSTCGQYVA